MPRPKRKTSATTLKMTPEVRQLWERCAAIESRSLTNMFEVMVREHAKKLRICEPMKAAVAPAAEPAPARRAQM